MADTAAHLVDRVLPEVPIRQWVLSLPFGLRYRLAYDADLVSDVLRIFVRAVFGLLRRRARIPSGSRLPRCGAVTFIQRFGDALNLNVHFHMLVLDGVYAVDEKGLIHFHPAAPPSDAEVARVAARILRRLERLLERRGLGPRADPEEADSLERTQPMLSELYGASVSGRVATGPRAGRRVTRVGDRIDVAGTSAITGPGCAAISGVSVHANVRIPAHDRMRLERLCRYAARPPVAAERLSLLPDGRLLYRLRHRWRDGTSHVIFEPVELVEKLAALVPPPRFNLVRYNGVLAPAAGWRSLIIPRGSETDDPVPHPGCPASEHALPQEAESSPITTACRPRNYSWAELMRRVFAVDVLECPRCHSRMRILAAIHPPDAIRKILDCLGLASRPPPIACPLPDRDLDGLYLS